MEVHKLYRVLIVDDSRMVRLALRSMLLGIVKAKFEVCEAENGRLALEVLATQPQVDLILTDMEMPVMDGLELIQELRRREAYKAIPILFLTAHAAPEEKVRAFQLGATDYILKPFLAPELQARVMGYLERQSAYRELAQQHRMLELEIEARTFAENALRESYETIRQQQIWLQQEMEQARETQKSLLPSSLPALEGVRLAHKFVPMEAIGGDFYNIFSWENRYLGMMITDVTGHGIPAALISFMVSGIFNHHVSGCISPAQVLQQTNANLYGKLPDEKFATMIYVIYDTQQKLLHFANAGHPSALVVRAGGEVFELQSRHFMLGLFDSALAQYHDQTFALLPGDKLLLFTDGIIEVTNGEEAQLGLEGLKSFLQENVSLPLEALLESLYEFGQEYSNYQGLGDDLTLVAMELLA